MAPLSASLLARDRPRYSLFMQGRYRNDDGDRMHARS
jgi:hypothetical protein